MPEVYDRQNVAARRGNQEVVAGVEPDARVRRG